MGRAWRRRSEIPKLQLFIFFLRNEEREAPLEGNSDLKRLEACPRGASPALLSL